jgi:hypothetical protein
VFGLTLNHKRAGEAASRFLFAKVSRAWFLMTAPCGFFFECLLGTGVARMQLYFKEIKPPGREDNNHEVIKRNLCKKVV